METANKPIDETSVRAALEEVLSSTEFQPEKAQSFAELLKQSVIDFFRWLDSLIPDGALASPFWAALVLMAASVFIFKLIKWYMKNSSEKLVAKQEVKAEKQRDFSLNHDSYKNAINQGQMREALWHLHRLWLLELNQKQQIQFCHWKSNQRYLSECSKEAEKKLASLTRLYEHCIYGGNEVDSEALQTYSLQDI